jgi:hypothetical protein
MSNLPKTHHVHLPDDAAIESRTRAIFRDACEHTDSYHALRLGLARRKSLNAGSSRGTMRVWLPLAGAAACCAVVAGVWLHPALHVGTAPAFAPSAPIAASHDAGAESIPDLGSNEMDMVQDLDFYRWLATQPDVATTAAGGGD